MLLVLLGRFDFSVYRAYTLFYIVGISMAVQVKQGSASGSHCSGKGLGGWVVCLRLREQGSSFAVTGGCIT